MPLLLAVTAVAVVLWLWWERSRELFCVSVRGGRAKLVRGRAPGGLVRSFEEACQQMRVQECTLIAKRDDHAARLVVRGIDDFYAQRLRNIFRLYPLSALKAAQPPVSGRVWRAIGISWLVWAFTRREQGW